MSVACLIALMCLPAGDVLCGIVDQSISVPLGLIPLRGGKIPETFHFCRLLAGCHFHMNRTFAITSRMGVPAA